MRQKRPEYTLVAICALFGVSRQAYYLAHHKAARTSIAHMVVLTLVGEFRAAVPMLGTRKLLHMLIPEMEKHDIKMGRDLLYDLLRFHGLLIRRRRRMVKTTDSHHWLGKYPNLITHLTVSAPEQLWVSDITYIRTLEGFSYLSLITDAYSRKIVGYALHPSLEAVGCIGALEMAVDGRKRLSPFILIHHSDRGIQYCSQNYTALLNQDRIAISMTQSGSPYENALAERVNGIIKNEFFPKKVYQNHKEAKKCIVAIIGHYNDRRPHASLNYHTPEQAHGMSGEIKKRWKGYPRPKKGKEENQVTGI
ncbi:IS3 family transposase [Mucilaginibacter sp. 5C4]|uniref:IS3 family transposase n=3 Tax=unclassified Mucilaginibacter TaxID=2617802 RepID=UPI002AC9DC77|nr:IS3 family transposase [Mucilaginibacter sp. 5C4]WPX24508.1 IS3 family transposase [Mucilaginibacter sp. 5C4]WPX25681.1 IS3 family transposase [Mucilaginibacter sp. 5C4]